MDKCPIIKVIRTKDGKGFVFWCPFCNRFHTHSCYEGHRLPHCINQDSPYLQTGGYILKECTREEIRTWNLPIKY